MSFPATALDPGQIYDLLVHAIAPRPIALVSTLDPEARPNLAPFSFFTTGGMAPPSVILSPVTKADGTEKDTLRNIRATGQFVINLLPHTHLHALNTASLPLPPGQSEWPRTGLQPLPSVQVAPPRVAGSLLSLECRLHQIVPHGHGPMSANYIIGEVLHFHPAPEIGFPDHLDSSRLDLLARLGDDWWLRTSPPTLFRLPRPTP